MSAIPRLPVGLLLVAAAIGLLWLLRVVTALSGRGTCHAMMSISTLASDRAWRTRTLRGVVLLLGAAAVVILVRHGEG